MESKEERRRRDLSNLLGVEVSPSQMKLLDKMMGGPYKARARTLHQMLGWIKIALEDSESKRNLSFKRKYEILRKGVENILSDRDRLFKIVDVDGNVQPSGVDENVTINVLPDQFSSWGEAYVYFRQRHKWHLSSKQNLQIQYWTTEFVDNLHFPVNRMTQIYEWEYVFEQIMLELTAISKHLYMTIMNAVHGGSSVFTNEEVYNLERLLRVFVNDHDKVI